MQHLDETFHQKIMLEHIIKELGGKPINFKANLPRSGLFATVTIRKNFTNLQNQK